MPKLSRGGIAYDLNVSPFTEVMKYEDVDGNSTQEVKYVFSSDFYRIKFLSKIAENRKAINHSLSKRFGFEITNEVLCDLVLYSKIEKRGFLIVNNGVKITCLNNIKLDGMLMMSKN